MQLFFYVTVKHQKDVRKSASYSTTLVLVIGSDSLFHVVSLAYNVRNMGLGRLLDEHDALSLPLGISLQRDVSDRSVSVRL